MQQNKTFKPVKVTLAAQPSLICSSPLLPEIKWRSQTKEFAVGVQSFLLIFAIHVMRRLALSSFVLWPWCWISAGIEKKESPLSWSLLLLQSFTQQACTIVLKDGVFRWVAWLHTWAQVLYTTDCACLNGYQAVQYCLNMGHSESGVMLLKIIWAHLL